MRKLTPSQPQQTLAGRQAQLKHCFCASYSHHTNEREHSHLIRTRALEVMMMMEELGGVVRIATVASHHTIMCFVVLIRHELASVHILRTDFY